MTTLPKSAGKCPVSVELTKGETYYFCTCGLSEKQPFCDSAHKGSGMKSLPFTAIKSETASLCMCKQSKTLPYCDGTHNTACCGEKTGCC